MTALPASRRVADSTALEQMLRASARALDTLATSRERRRLEGAEVHTYRRAAADAQRDAAAHVAVRLLPR